jgi:hypothetical protein
MSNIRTSYIRIFKKDGTHLATEEIEALFKLAVRAYHKFGSYWVRIQKKYRKNEKCLDIQFGSSKTYGDNHLESFEIFHNYYVWERVADEGGFDDIIFTLKDSGEYIETTDITPCIYKFNSVKIKTTSLSDYFASYNPIKLGENEFEIQLEGEYSACNSRSFFEVTENNPNYYGPCLQYDDKYETDFDTLSPDGSVTKSEAQIIQDIFVYPNKELRMNDKVELLWNERVVQTVERIENEVKTKSADYWDNCFSSDYIEFIKNKNRS